jgi:divalent metal cation (Fe/Co/Zn/Cd) transporter
MRHLLVDNNGDCRKGIVSMGKGAALFLVVVGIILIIYTIDLLVEHRTDTWIALLVLIANIISVIWNLGVFAKRR